MLCAGTSGGWIAGVLDDDRQRLAVRVVVPLLDQPFHVEQRFVEAALDDLAQYSGRDDIGVLVGPRDHRAGRGPATGEGDPIRLPGSAVHEHPIAGDESDRRRTGKLSWRFLGRYGAGAGRRSHQQRKADKNCGRADQVHAAAPRVDVITKKTHDTTGRTHRTRNAAPFDQDRSVDQRTTKERASGAG